MTSQDGSDVTDALLSDLRLWPVDLDLTLTRRRPDLLTWLLFLQGHKHFTLISENKKRNEKNKLNVYQYQIKSISLKHQLGSCSLHLTTISS